MKQSKPINKVIKKSEQQISNLGNLGFIMERCEAEGYLQSMTHCFEDLFKNESSYAISELKRIK